MIAENIASVRERIRTAAVRCGRNPEEILMVAVTKTFTVAHIDEALRAGVQDFGENYVQELERKREALAGRGVRWHFIGHLQTNKVKDIVSYVHLIHSVDSLRLAEELQRRGTIAQRTLDVLLEVHATDEPTKYGASPAAVLNLARAISRLDRVRVRGLMTMGPFSDDPDASRPSFRAVADLKKRIEAEAIPGVTMEYLSMGMTHDFEVAVEEGATILRIGTALFGTRARAT